MKVAKGLSCLQLARARMHQTPDKSNHTPSMAALNRTLYPARLLHIFSGPAAALQRVRLRWRALMQPDVP